MLVLLVNNQTLRRLFCMLRLYI